MTKEEILELRNKVINHPNVSEEEKRRVLALIDQGQTYGFDSGFSSIDRQWLKYYDDDAEEKIYNIPQNKSVWDVIEEKLIEHYDIPALAYFGREFSRPEFIESCYKWARTFRAMGVEENEVVPVYGPFVPDVCAMVFALNMIGACPYFLKLAISPQALEEETRESKVAVVYDGMWKNVAHEFSKDKFKSVIVVSATSDMPSPKKEIVSFLNKMQAIKDKSGIPNDKKYIWADKALDIANYYTGNVKVPFVKDRRTFITSSSGTTVGGVVKGTPVTNEAALYQMIMGDVAGNQFFPGDKCLTHFPPTASTSLNLLFLYPLFKGLTIHLDPRVSEKDFFNQLDSIKPNIAVNTSSMWESYFKRVARLIAKGMQYDLSHAKVWVVGGEGTDVNKFIAWNELMHICNNERGVVSGYGTSEAFASICTEKTNARNPFTKPVMGVGVPYAGLTVGIFDDNGNELKINQRGNLWVKGPSVMKGYYNKPELTKKAFENGWFKTGDLAEIDENGFVFIWGRVTDRIDLSTGKPLYLFDVAQEIKKHPAIADAVVLQMPTNENENNLVAHIAWKDEYSKDDKEDFIKEINEMVLSYIPEEIQFSAFCEHGDMLPYSQTTLKKDKNGMSNQTKGYEKVVGNDVVKVEFEIDSNGKYYMKEKQKGRKLILCNK